MLPALHAPCRCSGDRVIGCAAGGQRGALRRRCLAAVSNRSRKSVVVAAVPRTVYPYSHRGYRELRLPNTHRGRCDGERLQISQGFLGHSCCSTSNRDLRLAPRSDCDCTPTSLDATPGAHHRQSIFPWGQRSPEQASRSHYHLLVNRPCLFSGNYFTLGGQWQPLRWSGRHIYTYQYHAMNRPRRGHV